MLTERMYVLNEQANQFWLARWNKEQRKSVMITESDRWNEFAALKKVDATGAVATEASVSAIEIGYRYLQNFYASRNLKYVPRRMEMIPWLFNARFYSKRWEDTFLINPPHYDHCRYFIDQDTKQRIATIQPYSYPDYQRIDGDGRTPTMDESIDRVRVDSEKFALEHGLSVTVSKNGWYNPKKVILIEYTREKL